VYSPAPKPVIKYSLPASDYSRGENIGTVEVKLGFFHNDAPVKVELHENDTLEHFKARMKSQIQGFKEGDLIEATIREKKGSSTLSPDTDKLVNLGVIDGDQINLFKKYVATSPQDSPKIWKKNSLNHVRDGIPFQHHLMACKQVAELMFQNKVHTRSVYHSWIYALSQLSQDPAKFPKNLPQAMKTKSWALKTLQTQLASFTQLRHDFALYVKQPVLRGGCDYPFGYVEPVPEFYEAMKGMLAKLNELMKKKKNQWNGAVKVSAFLTRFCAVLNMLKGISEKELENENLSNEQNEFLKTILETLEYGSGPPKFEGWYPKLYFGSPAGCIDDDGLVADIFTHHEGGGDPGGVLHQGVRNPNLLYIVVDSGKDLMMYAGPVFSYYEFETEKGRFTDTGWQRQIFDDLPPRPDWTASFFS